MVLAGLSFLWASGTGSPLKMLVVPVAVGAFGYVLPNILLYNAGQKRETLMQRALPDALDLLTISVEAGLGFDAAVMRVARNTTGPLAQEFSRLLQEMQIGVGRMEAMRAMAERTSMADLKSFCLAMVQADQLGVPIGRVLRIQSNEMRVKRRQRAEEKAMQVPVKIMVPAGAVHPAVPVHRGHRAGRDPDRGRVLAMKAPTKRRRFELRLPWSSTPAPGSPHTWRVTTAVRVFGLTLLVGQVLDDGSLRATGVILMALAIVGTTCCAYELQTSRARMSWVAVTEGLMVGVLIGTAGGPVEPLLLYLAVPSVVAGISGGFVATTNTWLATVLAFTSAGAAGLAPGELDDQVGAALTWLLIGLGSGLLGAQQTRSLRRLEVAQAPYAAAHRLVGQLHSLVRSQSVELDVTHHGRAIQEAVRGLIHASPAILVRDANGRLEPVASTGALSTAEEEAGRLCVFYGQRLQRGDIAAFPLRVGQHVYGAVVLGGWSPLSQQHAEAVQQLLDEHAIALETALLVEDIRSVATSEERNRLARDIHDGVAQRIVALGYLVDDVSELDRAFGGDLGRPGPARRDHGTGSRASLLGLRPAP